MLSPAVSEIAEAAEFYEGRIKGLGVEFLDELDSTIRRILTFPQAWSYLAPPYRHCGLRRFPYTVIYVLESAEDVLIVSLFHQNREPKSWRNNL